jgi:hypothetical protein
MLNAVIPEEESSFEASFSWKVCLLTKSMIDDRDQFKINFEVRRETRIEFKHS